MLHLVPFSLFSGLKERLTNLAGKAMDLVIPSSAATGPAASASHQPPEAYFKSVEEMEIDFSYTAHTERFAGHKYPEAHDVYFTIVRHAEANGISLHDVHKGLLEENY